MRMSQGRRVPPLFVVAVLTAITCAGASRPAAADEPAGKPPAQQAAAQKTEPQNPGPQAAKPATIPLPRKRLHLLPRRVSDTQPEGRPAHRGLLAAELARQAVLIAARDELGLPTRDALLGDAVAKNDPDAVSVTTMVDPGGRFAVLLGPDRQSPRQFEPLNRVFTFAEAGGLVNYAELSAKLEHLSRELFPEFLEKSGFARLPSAPQAGAGEVDATTAKLLTRFSPVAQLTAVRRLHAIRAESVRSGPGQSTAVLEALAEGYANLAMLAQQVWSEQPVVYEARALLYAQRLWALDRKAPRGLWRLAYVLDMIGADWLALPLITDADELTKEAGGRPPVWRGAMLARLHYDPPKVRDWIVAEGSDDDYAGVQLFRSQPGEWWPTALSAATAAAFLERRHGGCTPITRRLAGPNATISEGHLGNGVSEEALAEDVGLFVEHGGPLPARVKAAVDPDNLLGTVPAALMKTGAGEPGEPSCRAVGRLMAELNMLSIADELSFRSWMLGVDVADVMKRRMPMLDPHEMKLLVLLSASEKRAGKMPPMTLPRPFITPQLAAHAVPAFIGTRVGGTDFGIDLLLHAIASGDDLGPDQAMLTRVAESHRVQTVPGKPVLLADLPARWARVSPHRAAAQMRAAWPDREGRLPDVEQLHRWVRNPETSMRVTKDLMAIGENTLAVRFLEEAVSLHHAADQYQSLAAFYYSQGRMTAWRQTLDDYLRHPDSGLGPAHARADIAHYLVDEGRPREALEYAQAAAESFSQQSLQSLAYAFEGLGEAEDANRIYAVIHDRYGGNGFDWYCAMIRLQADRTTPRDLVAAAARDPQAPQEHPWLGILLAEADGTQPQAIEALDRHARAAQAPNISHIELPLLLGETADRERQRERTREIAINVTQTTSPISTLLGDLYRAMENPDHYPPARIERIIAAQPRYHRPLFDYGFGWWLVQNGDRDLGRQLLTRAASRPTTQPLISTLARLRLDALDQPRR